MKETQAKQTHGPAWLFVYIESNKTLDKLESNQAMLRRKVARDVGYLKLTDPQFSALLESFTLPPDTQWLTLDPAMALHAFGPGSPGPEDLISSLRQAGWVPKEERREAFLKDHPDQGEAYSEAFEESARLEYFRLGLIASKTPVPAPWNTPDIALQEIAQALEGLIRIPDWVESTRPDFGMILMGETQNGAKEEGPLPQAFKESISRALNDVGSRLNREPDKARLWRTWASLAMWAPEASPLDLLYSLHSTPQMAWPPAPHVSVLKLMRFREDWAMLEKFASTGWGAFSPGTIPDEMTWRTIRSARITLWGLPRFEGLLRLGREVDAQAWLESIHGEAGAIWPSLIPAIKNIILLLGPNYNSAPIMASLDTLPVPDPPIPQTAQVGPLQLTFSGATAEFNNIYRSFRSFDIFSPKELHWVFDANAHGSEPYWSIQKNGNTVAQGLIRETIPSALVALCSSLRPPILEVLNNILSTNPDSDDIRRVRLKELILRMPNSHLEPALMKDASILTMEVVTDGNWTPNAEVWSQEAPKVLAKLEGRLNRFPSEVRTWRAWISWAQFQKDEHSLTRLVDSLAIWGVRDDWVRGLPENVALTEARDLKMLHRFDDLENWCRARMTLSSDGRLPSPSPTMAASYSDFEKMYSEARKALTSR